MFTQIDGKRIERNLPTISPLPFRRSFRKERKRREMGREGELYIPQRIHRFPLTRDFSTSRQSVEIFLRLFVAVRKKLVVNRKFQSNSAIYRERFVPLSRTISSFPLFAFRRFRIIVNDIFFFSPLKTKIIAFINREFIRIVTLKLLNFFFFNRRPFCICNETTERVM